MPVQANTAPVQVRGERSQGGARVEMRLVGEEQPLGEAAGEVGLEGGDARRVQSLEAAGAAGEAVELGLVAAEGDDEGAMADRARLVHPPIFGASRPSSTTGSSALSPSQKGASMPPAHHEHEAARRRAAVDDFDGAPRSASQGRRQAGDAGADDGDAHGSPAGLRQAREEAGWRFSRSVHPFASVTWIRFEGSPCRADRANGLSAPVGTPLGDWRLGAAAPEVKSARAWQLPRCLRGPVRELAQQLWADSLASNWGLSSSGYCW